MLFLSLLNGSLFRFFSSNVRQIQTNQVNGTLNIAASAGLALHSIQGPENKYIGGLFFRYLCYRTQRLLLPIDSWILYRSLGESTPSSKWRWCVVFLPPFSGFLLFYPIFWVLCAALSISSVLHYFFFRFIFLFSSLICQMLESSSCYMLLINSEVQFLLIMKITLRGGLVLCSVTMTSKDVFCIVPEVSFLVSLLSIGGTSRQ